MQAKKTLFILFTIFVYTPNTHAMMSSTKSLKILSPCNPFIKKQQKRNFDTSSIMLFLTDGSVIEMCMDVGIPIAVFYYLLSPTPEQKMQRINEEKAQIKLEKERLELKQSEVILISKIMEEKSKQEFIASQLNTMNAKQHENQNKFIRE